MTYQDHSKISSFKPPTAILVQELKNILPIGRKEFDFCSCDDENEQFRKEFQNKCMVVNQDLGPGSDKKVQCILVSKEAKCQEHKEQEIPEEGKGGLKELTLISPSVGRVAKVSSCSSSRRSNICQVSARARQCERCGVEETMMSACRQCSKVLPAPHCSSTSSAGVVLLAGL